MKNLLLIVLFLSFFQSFKAQVAAVMPADANDFYINAMPLVRQQVKEIILQTAVAIKYRRANADSLSQKLLLQKALKGLSSNDIEGITVLILVQASKDADADLKLIVLNVSRRNEQKQQPTAQTVSENSVENKNKSIEEIHDTQNAKLQLIMNRKRMMAEEISTAMKKISGAGESIINNLK
jgi:hypothetical protein